VTPIYHIWEGRRIKHSADKHRVALAQKSWAALEGVTAVCVEEIGRTSQDLGDYRQLPFLRDILEVGFKQAADTILLFTNDDTWLHPKLPELLRYHVPLYGACCSRRCDFKGDLPHPSQKPELIASVGQFHRGRDMFAFTAKWLRDHWGEVPDFVLGAAAWDTCLAMIIRKAKGCPFDELSLDCDIHPCEIPPGYVAHLMHPPPWQRAQAAKAPSNVHNLRLYNEWVNAHAHKKFHRPLIIRRGAALGDSLSATVVVKLLKDNGYDAVFQADPLIFPVLRRVPGVRFEATDAHTPDVNLDGAYENDLERAKKHYVQMWVEQANRQLSKLDISIPNSHDATPRMVSDLEVRAEVMPLLLGLPKPWVMVVPRSFSWVTRTVPDDLWELAARYINGTCFWLGRTDAPKGFVDLKCKTVEHMIEFVGAADLYVGVDTGPAHIALAMGVPSVVIAQQSYPHNHFSDQQPWMEIQPDLDCIGCCLVECPINKDTPPCQQVDPAAIADAANRQLRTITSEDVSAVVCVYKPNIEQLNRCLLHLLYQVQEIVVVGSLDTPWPLTGMMSHEKIKVVRNLMHNTGYSRNANFGARHSTGKYIWFVNDDLFPEPDVAAKLLTVMAADRKVGAVSHTLRYPNGTIQYAGKNRTRGEFGFGHLDHRGTTVRFNAPVEQEVLCGASMMVRRKAYYEVGGYSEKYALYSEDDDFSLKLRRAGYKTIFHPGANGMHIEHCSTDLIREREAITAQSAALFASVWRDYFTHNPDPFKLGTFDYLQAHV
jgi:GT2 family glycosyltransferase